MKTVALDTLGCKLSFAETSTFARRFREGGYLQVPGSEKADIYVVNTCAVTEHAAKKGRNLIRKLHRLNPDARIVVTGCYAQLNPGAVAELEGVWAVVGSQYKPQLYEIATAAEPLDGRRIFVEPIAASTSYFPAYSSADRTRSFLKVQDGCDYHCAYCTVPLARGDSRNPSIETVVAQAREIAAEGVKEVVITGVNTGDFGKSTGESFFDLLKALNDVEGIERYRISSIEPNLLTNEIIDWISAGTKFVPHFHIPLQSGCDRILQQMGRRYTTAFFAEKIAYIRSRMDHVFLGIDVIVGFPGETDEDFQATYSFLERLNPAFIHIFPYSRRADTPAAVMKGQVQECVKTKRVEALEELCRRCHSAFYEANRGRRGTVLFESTDRNGMMSGYTSNYIRVERPYDETQAGRLVEVEI
ncbi:MAG: tRNA (N(6)-L-threonylcarbamoyladenosine(37)-C(2))-methylthiotransferase MtaB [Bacteroidales bacterium]|nr:tRNA (N(6)-L-threonylcarbamoyladenosine(37)-C(2))-methylthiotransferase MtaB [Candidatus Equibacterium intestinale]